MLKDVFENKSEPDQYEYAANFLIHGAYQVVCMWLNKENRESSEWMAQFLVDILIRY